MRGVPIKKRFFRPSRHDGILVCVEECSVHVWWILPAFAGRAASVKHWFMAFYKPPTATVAAKSLLNMLEADVIDASHLNGVLKSIGFSGPDDQEPPMREGDP